METLRHLEGGHPMRQIRISKRRTHSAAWQQEPPRLDPRDPDIVKTYRLTPSRRSRHTGRQHPRQMPT
jgi:hypothetical protein